tara:strand:+ start:620 stop:1645 length:1026 start_codon:yes stop_codon:yes gene_type:complete
MLILPVILIAVFLIIWPSSSYGYINLIYTFLFGWILMQNSSFTKSILKFTLYVQLSILIFEVVSQEFLFQYLESGIFQMQTFDFSVTDQNTTGFRAKGLFTGTLIASSFCVYLSMIFRNNTRLLSLIFLMAILTNGRLAILVSGFTLIFKLFKKYDLRIEYRKLNLTLKLIFFVLPLFALTSILLVVVLPESNLNNLLNVFNLKSPSNFGRLFAYGQAISSYLDYGLIEKLFGSPNNEIFDIYGRKIASESGFLSMFLDIGIVGFTFYLYYLIRSWRMDDRSILDLRSKLLSMKYVIIITFLSFLQYEHINGNLRGMLFWFIILSHLSLYKNDERQLLNKV